MQVSDHFEEEANILQLALAVKLLDVYGTVYMCVCVCVYVSVWLYVTSFCSLWTSKLIVRKDGCLQSVDGSYVGCFCFCHRYLKFQKCYYPLSVCLSVWSHFIFGMSRLVTGSKHFVVTICHLIIFLSGQSLTWNSNNAYIPHLSVWFTSYLAWVCL